MSGLVELLKRREDRLRVIVVPGDHGGYDVALVLDGTYGDLTDAMFHAASFREQVAVALTAHVTEVE